MKAHYHALAITPLSPVHMGTNDDYEPTNYVIDGGALFEFDALAALHMLPSSERQCLDRILSGKPTQNLLQEVQAFFYKNRQAMIACSRRQVRVNPSIEAFYKERVGKVAQHEQGGKKVQNCLQIERTAWNPVSGHPILPGSGLKGAIRTALLDEKNAGRPLQGRKECNRELQNRLFDYRADQFELDPMRLIGLSDASLAEGRELPTRVWFGLNRKKQPVWKNGQLVASKDDQRGLYQLLECLPPMHARSFEGSLSIQDLAPIEDVSKTPRLRFSMQNIAAACNRFYRPILQRELKLLRKRGYLDEAWGMRIGVLLEQFGPLLDDGRAFLLRVGRHSGAESVSLEGVRKIRILKRNGEKHEWRDSAKTVWLAGNERQAQTGLLPFGWLLVETDPEGSLPWQASQRLDEDVGWLTEIRERVAWLAETTAQARAEQEERQRRQAEEEAARRAVEEALANLSPEQQQIAKLRRVFEEEQAKGVLIAGSQTADLRMKLLRDARQWEDLELRREAATLLRDIVAKLPWSKKAKKQGIPAEVDGLDSVSR